MSALQIGLFGRLHIRCNEHMVKGFETGKAPELLCYLLIYRDWAHARETIAGVLWGDGSTMQARKGLRQALWQIQAAVEPQADLGQKRLLQIEQDWIQLNADADLYLDVRTFEQACAAVQGIAGHELSVEEARILMGAADLYVGDLLAGWYQDWCILERERLQNMYLALLDKLMDYCEAQAEYETGLSYGARILRHDRARERTHRRLMRLQYMAGNRTEALRQYERCAAALSEELDVRPARRTIALYEQIRADQLPIPVGRQPATSRALTAGTAALPEMLGRLRRIQAALADFQCQVDQEIRAVELALEPPPSGQPQ